MHKGSQIWKKNCEHVENNFVWQCNDGNQHSLIHLLQMTVQSMHSNAKSLNWNKKKKRKHESKAKYPCTSNVFHNKFIDYKHKSRKTARKEPKFLHTSTSSWTMSPTWQNVANLPQRLLFEAVVAILVRPKPITATRPDPPNALAAVLTVAVAADKRAVLYLEGTDIACAPFLAAIHVSAKRAAPKSSATAATNLPVHLRPPLLCPPLPPILVVVKS